MCGIALRPKLGSVLWTRRSIPLQYSCSESSPRALHRLHRVPSSSLSTRRQSSTSPGPSRCRPRQGRSHCCSGAHSRRWRGICLGTPLWRLRGRRGLRTCVQRVGIGCEIYVQPVPMRISSAEGHGGAVAVRGASWTGGSCLTLPNRRPAAGEAENRGVRIG